jgi:hypothetical protein
MSLACAEESRRGFDAASRRFDAASTRLGREELPCAFLDGLSRTASPNGGTVPNASYNGIMGKIKDLCRRGRAFRDMSG